MKIIIYLTAILIFYKSYSLNETNAIKGGYRKCEVYSYRIKYGVLDSSSKYLQRKMIYDSNGFNIEVTMYSADHRIFLHEKYEFKHNRLYKIYNFYNESILSRITTYNYDDMGHIIEEVQTDPSMFVVYKNTNTYKNDYKLREEIKDNDENRNSLLAEYKNVYQYNDENQLIKVINYDKSLVFKNHQTLVYTPDGNILEQDFFDSHNYLAARINYTYNSEGLLILYHYVDLKFSQSNNTIKYQYDKFGNKIEELNESKMNHSSDSKTVYVYSK